MYEISLLEREPQWVPAKWVKVINVTGKILNFEQRFHENFYLRIYISMVGYYPEDKTYSDANQLVTDYLVKQILKDSKISRSRYYNNKQNKMYKSFKRPINVYV